MKRSLFQKVNDFLFGKPVTYYDSVKVTDIEKGLVERKVGDEYEPTGDTISDIKHHHRYESVILEFEEGEGDIWIPDHRIACYIEKLD